MFRLLPNSSAGGAPRRVLILEVVEEFPKESLSSEHLCRTVINESMFWIYPLIQLVIQEVYPSFLGGGITQILPELFKCC